MQLQHKTPVDAQPLLQSFQRHLRAERKDPDTLGHYLGATKQFLAFCRIENLPAVEHVTREHVEMWLERLHEQYRPHTVRNRYVGLRIFFKWLEAEGEIERNPMARIRPPSVEEVQKDVVPREDMARLLAHLEKQKRWRDCALIAVLYDTGMRASEVADCLMKHVNLDTGLIVIPRTKGDRVRTVQLSPTAVRYVDRYVRRRKDPEYLFEGTRGKMTRSGIYWTVRQAFEEIGIPNIGAHDLRHTSASHVAAEMSESAMMALYGWTDPGMARHYARQVQVENALEAHRRASPLEKITKQKSKRGR